MERYGYSYNSVALFLLLFTYLLDVFKYNLKLTLLATHSCGALQTWTSLCNGACASAIVELLKWGLSLPSSLCYYRNYWTVEQLNIFSILSLLRLFLMGMVAFSSKQNTKHKTQQNDNYNYKQYTFNCDACVHNLSKYVSMFHDCN